VLLSSIQLHYSCSLGYGRLPGHPVVSAGAGHTFQNVEDVTLSRRGIAFSQLSKVFSSLEGEQVRALGI
jgi:hypothetical protein